MRTRDAVRIDIRAAELAQRVHEKRGMTSIGDESSDMMTVQELVGWMRAGDNRERGSYPKSHAWQAGWLAAHIWYERR